MEKNGKTKNIVLAVLLVAVVTLSIAYAVLSATLTINAQATVKGANWDVEFQKKGEQSDPVCVASSKSGAATTTAQVKTDATIAATSMTGLTADLKLPGDKVVCTWQVINKGTIDARLATYTAPVVTYDGTTDADETTVRNNTTVTLTIDGQEPVQGRKLPATSGNVEDVVLTIQYNENATALPSSDVIVKAASTTFIYEQD